MTYQDNRPQNVTVNLNLIDLKKYKRQNDDPDEIISVLEKITWDLINFPVQIPRRCVNNDDSKGFITIGYVDSYMVDKGQFVITIFGKYIDMLERVDNNDLVVWPKTIFTGMYPIVQAIHLGPESNFEYLTRPPRPRKFENKD